MNVCIMNHSVSIETISGVRDARRAQPGAEAHGEFVMAAKKGDTVFVHYTGKLDDGTVFDSSLDREPLEFVLGSGMILSGCEGVVEGRDVGDKMSVSIPADEAYGQHDDALVITVPRCDVPMQVEPEVGKHVQVTVQGGDLDLVITRVTDDEIELDGNHPLAGKDLSFDIEIMRIRPGA